MNKSLNHFWVGFQDVIILAQSIETAANSVGIGSCYIGTTLNFMKEIQEQFKLPKGVVPIVLLPMGYIDQEPRIANKLDLDIVFHDDGTDFYYINRGLERGLNLDSLKTKVLNKTVTLHLAKVLSGITSEHISQLAIGDEIIFTEFKN